MTKKSIKSRYTIEYVNPESPAYKKSSSAWWLFIFTMIGLLALGLTASVFYPFKTTEQLLIPVVAVDPQEESLDEPIDIEEDEDEQEPFGDLTLAEEEKEVALKEVKQLTLQNKKLQEEQQKSIKQLAENGKLTKGIDEIKTQLDAEKNKNKNLDAQLAIYKSKNSELLDLLAEAEKRYNSVLSKLNKKEPQEGENKTVTERVTSYKAISDEIEEIEHSKPQKPNPSGNSQVDSIVAAMQGIKKNTAKIDKTKESSKESKTSNENTEPLHEKLQKQIGRLNKNTKLEISKSNASSKEVRSIVVKKGETLWDIAERMYGNGSEYKRIIDANPQITKNGRTILKVGQTIRVPI